MIKLTMPIETYEAYLDKPVEVYLALSYYVEIMNPERVMEAINVLF